MEERDNRKETKKQVRANSNRLKGIRQTRGVENYTGLVKVYVPFRTGREVKRRGLVRVE